VAGPGSLLISPRRVQRLSVSTFGAVRLDCVVRAQSFSACCIGVASRHAPAAMAVPTTTSRS